MGNSRNENNEEDIRTFDVIRKVGNEIHSSIQLTADTPSNHHNNKVPILNLKCWREEIEEEGQKRFAILHEHYMKDVSSKAVIHRESALSLRKKVLGLARYHTSDDGGDTGVMAADPNHKITK